MYNPEQSRFKELRQRVEATEEKVINEGLPTEMRFSPAEQVRYEENKRFAENIYYGFRWILNHEQGLTPEAVEEYVGVVGAQLSLPQQKILERMKQRLLKDIETAKQIDVDRLRKSFVSDVGWKVEVSKLGVLTCVVDAEGYDKLFKVATAPEGLAITMWGFLVPPDAKQTFFTDDVVEEMRGLPIVIIRKMEPNAPEQYSTERIMQHELFHAFYDRVVQPEFRSAYRRPFERRVYGNIQNELVAYLRGNQIWRSLLPLLLPRAEGGHGGAENSGKETWQELMWAQLDKRLQPSEEAPVLQELAALKDAIKAEMVQMKLAGMVPQDIGNLKIDIVLAAQKRMQAQKQAERARRIRQRSPEEVERAKKKVEKHMGELYCALREVARLDLLQNRSVDEGEKGILFAQSFKEIAYNLSQIEADTPIDLRDIMNSKPTLSDFFLKIEDAIFFALPLSNVEFTIEWFEKDVRKTENTWPPDQREAILEMFQRIVAALKRYEQTVSVYYPSAQAQRTEAA